MPQLCSLIFNEASEHFFEYSCTIKSVNLSARISESISRLPVAVLIAVDALAWSLGILAALVLRYDFTYSLIKPDTTVALIAVTVLLQILFGYLFYLYRKRFSIASFEEAKVLVVCVTVVLVPAAILGTVFGYGNGIPRTTMIIAAPIACSLMAVARYMLRALGEQRLLPSKHAHRALIYGAGHAGSVTVRNLLTDPQAQHLPVGFLDDDTAKRNRQVRGVKVLGAFSQLAEIAESTRASEVIVCIGDADAALLRRVYDSAAEAGLRVMVMPPLAQILAGRSAISDLRDISMEDLIGRHPVRLITENITTYLSGKRVLVTGAGGSIGSELCRQLMNFGISELIMLDRDETALQQTQISIRGNGLLDTRDVVLADIRDSAALDAIFADRRPEVVFHAAALKHLPMLEQYPDEAWKTNVCGTLNVLQAAYSVGVETFVNISTDKAANPTSVLGHSKRVAEKLTAWMAQHSGQRYLSVRFGNVIGSRGSMLPTFKRLIEQGGPITITHPDVTRFFMTIPEACQLVMQAGGIGEPGQVLILDMGEPVRILDVAKRMILQSGKDIDIVYTGLRKGEKLHEVLVAEGEGVARPFHPKISHASIGQISPEQLDYDGWISRLR